MFGHADSHFHGVGLVDEPHEEEIGGCADDAGDDEAEEDDAHHAHGEAMHVDVYQREGFEE